MNKKDLELWNDITFKTIAYRKNFDFFCDGDNIITEYDGTILKLKINKLKHSHIIGEYSLSSWNIELGKKLGVDFKALIKEHSNEVIYSELLDMIERKIFDITNFKKIVFIHTLILQKNYRKCHITDEFIEMIYRDFYDKNTIIIALVMPFQYNPIDFEYYTKNGYVQTPNKKGYIPIMEYYSIQDFMAKNDKELNEYKLFSVASRCEFIRIEKSHLFIFQPQKIVNRIAEKYLESTKSNTTHL